MSYELLWEPRGVYLQFGGQVSINDILNATIQFEGNSRFDNLRYVIADYSRITGCDAKPTDIYDVWVMDAGAKRSNPNIKKAIVTTTSEVIELARCYKSMFMTAYPTEIFSTEVDARKWLGLSDELQ